jgi:outer membrane receptor protein involved in Fe transport
VRATFEDNFSYSRDGVQRDVSKGNRLPGVPEHNIKVGADYAFTKQFSVGTTASYSSSQYLRGDEANEDSKLGGYTVVNLHGRYKVTDNFQIFAKVDNLFDKEYENFGLYGEPDEAPGLSYTDQRFVGAGAPRAGWLGFKITM